MRTLVAGASGALGRIIVSELELRGHAVRAVVRRPGSLSSALSREVRTIDALRPGAWRNACEGIDAVVSTVGASVSPSPFVGRKSYAQVDAPANIALLEEAERAGVKRFVYISLVGGDTSRHTDYAEGHERVVDALAASAVPSTVLRPTGFFCAMTALIDLARKGAVPVFGDGSCRTNPIAEQDLALAAAASVDDSRPGVTQVALGGPEVFTRREIALLTFASLGRRPRLIPFPVWLANAAATAVHPLNPRFAHFTRFAAHVMTHDCLAPPVGSRRLGDRFREHARQLRAQ